MTLPSFRLPLIIALALMAPAQSVIAQDAKNRGSTSSPTLIDSSSQPFGGFSDGPVKSVPYQWLEDDPATPMAAPTVQQFVTVIDDVDPNDILERPGIPIGWFVNLELTAAKPRVSDRMQSGSLLSGTFLDPITPPSAPLDWTAMPKFTVGYRRPEGLGELSASYRFLFSQGSSTGVPFGSMTGNVTSNLQVHTLDLDYTLADLFPNDLSLVPRQINLSGGVRVAGVENKTSASGGPILTQSAQNTFVGAGPRFALESVFPIASNQWAVFGKVDTSAVIGSDRQTFVESTTGASTSATSPVSTIAVPVVGLRAGVHWYPPVPRGNMKVSAGFQWERWYFMGTSSSSFNELTIEGPFLQGEIVF